MHIQTFLVTSSAPSVLPPYPSCWVSNWPLKKRRRVAKAWRGVRRLAVARCGPPLPTPGFDIDFGHCLVAVSRWRRNQSGDTCGHDGSS
jgi:hypothetical protein